jgi:hypothetical protein
MAVQGNQGRVTAAGRRSAACRGGIMVLAILLLPLLLGAWRDVDGNTINPKYVERIKDGQTTKQEILVLFGDPQELRRTPEGVIFKYKSFRDAPMLTPYKHDERKIAAQSDQIYLLDDKKQIKKPVIKTEGKILRSTLEVRFKSDGQTVLNHEYEEVKGSGE